MTAESTEKLARLRAELGRAEDAVVHSDDYLRSLPDQFEGLGGAGAKIDAGDLSRCTAASLSLNARLHARAGELRAAVERETLAGMTPSERLARLKQK